jgi:hypothetical protein
MKIDSINNCHTGLYKGWNGLEYCQSVSSVLILILSFVRLVWSVVKLFGVSLISEVCVFPPVYELLQEGLPYEGRYLGWEITVAWCILAW